MNPNIKRPLGVTVMGTVEIIKGGLGLTLYFQGNIPESMPWITAAAASICIIKIILGAGLLKMQEWARKAMIIFMTLLILAMAFILMLSSVDQLLQKLILSGSCIALIFIYYLTRTYVKELFRP